MAKKNPHKRKKLSTKKSPKKTVKFVAETSVEEQFIENRQERSWSVMLILAFIIFVALGLLLIILNNQGNDNLPGGASIESASSTNTGITIDGGNLGQISNPATAGIQSNASPIGGNSAPTSPDTNNSGQSGQLQPTGDKCAYRQFDQSLQNTCVSQ